MIYARPEDVVACYRLLFGREPDSVGLKHFNDLVAGGRCPATYLAGLFLASPEFAARQREERRLASSTRSVRLRDFPLEMLTAPTWNAVHREIAETKTYEPHITREFRRLQLRGKVFVDVGANIGYYTVLAGHLGATVHAFEPGAGNVWFLLRNLAANGLAAEVYPCAVADAERLLIYTPNEGNGQIGPLGDAPPTPEEGIVRSVTLDKVLGGVRVDVMKLDVEGAEGLALRGAERILRDRPLLFLEFAPVSIAGVSGEAPEDFLARLVGLGYRVEVIRRDGGGAPANSGDVIEVARNSHGGFADLMLVPD